MKLCHVRNNKVILLVWHICMALPSKDSELLSQVGVLPNVYRKAARWSQFAPYTNTHRLKLKRNWALPWMDIDAYTIQPVCWEAQTHHDHPLDGKRGVVQRKGHKTSQQIQANQLGWSIPQSCWDNRLGSHTLQILGTDERVCNGLVMHRRVGQVCRKACWDLFLGIEQHHQCLRTKISFFFPWLNNWEGPNESLEELEQCRLAGIVVGGLALQPSTRRVEKLPTPWISRCTATESF